jgi:translation initiation factor IF-2
VDDVKQAMSGLLAPSIRETLLGNAQILEIFKVSKVGNIAGCRVTDGTSSAAPMCGCSATTS